MKLHTQKGSVLVGVLLTGLIVTVGGWLYHSKNISQPPAIEKETTQVLDAAPIPAVEKKDANQDALRLRQEKSRTRQRSTCW